MSLHTQAQEIKEICGRCDGSGQEPDGWTLEDARKDPQGFNDYRIIRDHGPDSGIVNLMNTVVSPLLFKGGIEKCKDCKGNGKTVEWTKAESKIQQTEQSNTDEIERSEWVKKYPYLQKTGEGKQSYHTLAAKNIRTELKREFPGVKFSVRSSSFSMGNDVNVSWTDGPTTEEVEGVTGKYQQGVFNGMEDIYEYGRSVFTEIFGGSKYVMESRTTTVEKKRLIVDELGYPEIEIDKWGCIQDRDVSDMVSRELQSRSFYTRPGKAATAKAEPVENVTITENDEKDGVEIRFPTKPDRSLLDTIKGRGFRWSRFGKCWYKKRTVDALTFAHSLAA